MGANGAILLVEDNEDDVFLMLRALREAGIQNLVEVVEDGQQAVDYLSRLSPLDGRTNHPLPAMIFLDLKLPLKSGHEVLTWIRQQEPFKSLLVVVLTSSDEPADYGRSYHLGATSYLLKPPTAEKLIDLAKAFSHRDGLFENR